MKIIFADQFSQPGGAQQCLIDLLPAILERGWQPLVMAPGNGQLLQWCAQNQIPVRTLPLSNYSSGRKNGADALRLAVDWPRARSAVRRAAAEHGCDLLYINGPRVLPAIVGLGLRGIFHAHSRIGGAVSRALARSLLQRERVPVIAVSRFIATQFPQQHISVVYNGVADCANEKKPANEGLRIGMLGRIAPEKGQLDFIRAARLIGQQLPSTRFEIFGAPLFSNNEYDRAVRHEATDLPVAFHGWQQREAVFAAIDILAVPSGPDEGAGRVIPEAFSAGVPVVAYAAGGIPELIEHGRTGLLAETSSPESLAKSLLELIRHRDLRQQLSAAARAEWSMRFTQEAYRRQICDRIQDRASQ